MQLVNAFGDHIGDGLIQLSFTLPVNSGKAAELAAKSLVEKIGMKSVEVVHSISLTDDSTYFIVYAKSDQTIDFEKIQKLEPDFRSLSKGEIENKISESSFEKITVIGASTGSDTHSVGIDAILNHKGYNSNYGLEAFNGFEVYNLGSQVENERLISEAVRVKADAILVSQTVTQQDLHISNLTELIDMLEVENLRDQFVVVCGGPRLSSGLAKELGYDAAFSKGSYGIDVASYLVSKLVSS